LNRTLIIVEGPTDKAFVEVMTEGLRVACKTYIAKGNKPEKVTRLLRASAKVFSKAIILKDLHRGDLDRSLVVSKVAKVVSQLKGLKAYVVQVERSIESWILAGLSADIDNPEDLPDPEEELGRLMQREGKYYVKSPEVYKRLAQEVDVERARAKSKTFEDFLRHLKDCEG